MRFLGKVVGVTERAPFVVVGHRGDAQEAFVELAAVAVLIVVGEANHAAGGIDQLVFDGCVVEAFAGVEEDDSIVPAKVGGLLVECGDRFSKAKLADVVAACVARLVVAHTGGFDHAGGGDDLVGGQDGAVVELDGGGFAAAGVDLLDAALHLANAAE